MTNPGFSTSLPNPRQSANYGHIPCGIGKRMASKDVLIPIPGTYDYAALMRQKGLRRCD